MSNTNNTIHAVDEVYQEIASYYLKSDRYRWIFYTFVIVSTVVFNFYTIYSSSLEQLSKPYWLLITGTFVIINFPQIKAAVWYLFERHNLAKQLKKLQESININVASQTIQKLRETSKIALKFILLDCESERETISFRQDRFFFIYLAICLVSITLFEFQDVLSSDLVAKYLLVAILNLLSILAVLVSIVIYLNNREYSIMSDLIVSLKLAVADLDFVSKDDS